MAKISIDAVRPWLAALYDRLPAVRQAALRLLVHLPLDDSGWIELGALLQKWLKTFNPTANLPAQSIHGFSFWELADLGRWIPAPELRAVFHRLLPDLGTVDQSRLAGLLAQAGDQESLEAILNRIGVEDQSDWSYIAESLSFGDIARWTDKVEAIFRQHPVPDSRFWLAVALALPACVAPPKRSSADSGPAFRHAAAPPAGGTRKWDPVWWWGIFPE